MDCKGMKFYTNVLFYLFPDGKVMNKFFSAYKKAFRICLNCEKNNEWLCKVFIVQKSEFIPNFAQKFD